MTNLINIEKKDYEKLNEGRIYANQYIKCFCGKYYIRRNRTNHFKTKFHKKYKENSGFNIEIPKKKIIKEKEKIEYDTEYVSIWGKFK
jgi:hypothetical protein